MHEKTNLLNAVAGMKTLLAQAQIDLPEGNRIAMARLQRHIEWILTKRKFHAISEKSMHAFVNGLKVLQRLASYGRPIESAGGTE